MGEESKGKRSVIPVSSSSSSEEEEEEEDSDDDEYVYEDEDEMSDPPSSDDWNECSDDEGIDPESVEDHDVEIVDDESLCLRVINLLQGGNDLQGLKLDECKPYLRKHGLRLSGTKAVCIERIQEHWRIKDGKGENLYPRSSFFINCTGDVCKGDVVLFTQRVYEKFDKVKRSGKLLGKRTIAGKVVKESYGVAKQQHTFTIEILWSKGLKKLPPLFPLLVKGRNLYKLKTFRQRWDNEAERSRVLAEKHKRGMAARLVRGMKRPVAASGGAKRKRHSHHMRPSQARCRNTRSMHVQPEKRVKPAQAKMERDTKEDPKTSVRYCGELTYPNEYRVSLQPFSQNNYYNQMQFEPRSVPHMTPAYREAFPISYHVASTSNEMRTQHPRPYMNLTMAPPLQPQGVRYNYNTHHAYSDPIHQFDGRNLNHFQHQFGVGRQLYPINLGRQVHGQEKSGYLHCVTPGCPSMGSEDCAVSSCWRCCRMRGERCLSHEWHYPFR